MQAKTSNVAKFQEALGHTSRAVHEAYARGAAVICPPLDEYEKNVHAEIVVLPTVIY